MEYYSKKTYILPKIVNKFTEENFLMLIMH